MKVLAVKWQTTHNKRDQVMWPIFLKFGTQIILELVKLGT